MKNVHIFGGGTIAHVANHFALSAPAYGHTARKLEELCRSRFSTCDVFNHLTRMADPLSEIVTNEDVKMKVDELKADPNTKVIFFNCALVDFQPAMLVQQQDTTMDFGKKERRIESRGGLVTLTMKPSDKIIKRIRDGRKDIFLVGFKTTCGANKQTMFEKGLRLCKEASVNLVLVNDTKTRWNMIVTPEEAAYHETDNREIALQNLVEMAYLRSHLTFTQSTVVAGNPVGWNDERVPDSLRKIVNHCVNGKAYKEFNGGTVGHFAVKISSHEFLTSIRKSNFNDLDKVGLVYVKTNGPDTVLAYGAKPSVGGQSQRIVFREHEGMDCIVHFHCPLREGHPDPIPVRSQREVECGSHQCGQNTSSGLKAFGNLKAVMLDQHGPNIVFNRSIDPQEVIDFIERNFDLTKKTGGYII